MSSPLVSVSDGGVAQRAEVSLQDGAEDEEKPPTGKEAKNLHCLAGVLGSRPLFTLAFVTFFWESRHCLHRPRVLEKVCVAQVLWRLDDFRAKLATQCTLRCI